MWLYSRLPNRVPAHWNVHGEIDRHGAPWEAAFLLPGIMTLMAVILYLVSRRRELHLMLFTILGFMFCVHLVIGYSASTGRLPQPFFGADPVWAVVVAILSWGFAGWLYTRLPEVVPIHWGLNGEVDGVAGRAVGAFVLPVMLTVIGGLMLALSRDAPVLLVGGFMLALQVVLAQLQLRYRPG